MMCTVYSARVKLRAGYEFYGCHDNKLLQPTVTTCDPTHIYTLQGCQLSLSLTAKTVKIAQENLIKFLGLNPYNIINLQKLITAK
jgi:hypothetical protein